MITSQTISGYPIQYETDDTYTSYGIKYLYNLRPDEWETVFYKAKNTGEAAFMDTNSYHYALVQAGGVYTLISKN